MEKTVNDLLKSYENGRLSRRQLVSGLTLLASGAASVSAQGTAPKTLTVNHIAVSVGDLKKSTEFYTKVFNLGVARSNEKESFLAFGDSQIVMRPVREGQKPGLNHFMFGVGNYNENSLQTWLKSHGLDPRKDLDSFHIKDPDGMDVQIGDKDLKG